MAAPHTGCRRRVSTTHFPARLLHPAHLVWGPVGGNAPLGSAPEAAQAPAWSRGAQELFWSKGCSWESSMALRPCGPKKGQHFLSAELLLAALHRGTVLARSQGSSPALLCLQQLEGETRVPAEPTGDAVGRGPAAPLGSDLSRDSRAAGELPPAFRSVLVAGTELQFTINLLFELIVL